jgi:hypothetical protein
VTWIVYALGPIDWGWENLKTVAQTVAEIAKNSEEIEASNDVNAEGVRRFLDSWESAKEAAAEAGWEGDFRHAPYVFWLPGEVDFVHAFVFKQDNNGTAFVVSPQELPAAARLAS